MFFHTNNLQIQREKGEKTRHDYISSVIEIGGKTQSRYVFISSFHPRARPHAQVEEATRKEDCTRCLCYIVVIRSIWSRYRLIYRESREPGVLTKPLAEPCSRIFHRSVSQSGNSRHSADRSYRVGCSSVEIRYAMYSVARCEINRFICAFRMRIISSLQGKIRVLF